MVGFLHHHTEEEEELNKAQKPVPDNDPFEPENLPSDFADSFFDFDSINTWAFEGNITEFCEDSNNMANLGENIVDFGELVGDVKESLEVKSDCIYEKDGVENELSGTEGSLLCLGQEKVETGNVETSGLGVFERIKDERVLNEGGLGEKTGVLGCLIEEKLEKVSLDGGDGNVKSGENVSDNDESSDDDDDVESDDESSSSDSSSSSSGSDEDEEEEESGVMSIEKKGKKEGGMAMEEGEIVLSDADTEADEMVAWSDNEDDINETGAVGPITSKNELKELPPVPSVTVTLEPHHQTLPVGIILSVLGAQVIVEGVEEHSPLTEGSILWITESRLPLGIVDEIFGPVKNPYYIVRYNSESEVPNRIQQGTTLISFVKEFANHILKDDKSLYQKGYDASGENDEEISDDLEFSDDEKEAEYKKKLKMKKRGTNESSNKPVTTKRNEKRQFKNQSNRNRGDPSAKTQLNQENHAGPSGLGPGLGGDQPVGPPFPQSVAGPDFCAPNGLWSNGLFPHQQQQSLGLPNGFPNQQQQSLGLPNGFPNQQQQSLGLPNGLPPNGMLWMQQQNQQQPFHQLYQTPLQTGVTFQQQQQMSGIPGMPFNFNAVGGQPNFGGAPGFAPWPAFMPQTVLNQPNFGLGLPGQHAQGVPFQGSQSNLSMQASSGNSEEPFNSNQGRGGGGGGGRRGHHRGRGRFGGGRGRHQNH